MQIHILNISNKNIFIVLFYLESEKNILKIAETQGFRKENGMACIHWILIIIIKSIGVKYIVFVLHSTIIAV